MFVLFAILSFLFTFVGLFSLSNATTGVGLICAGCFFVIFARIIQASTYHKDLVNILTKEEVEPEEEKDQAA